MTPRRLAALAVLLLPGKGVAPEPQGVDQHNVVEARACAAERVVQSIARHEGWESRNSLVRRLHNPGALVYARQPGSRPGPQGYAVFENDAAGWAALRNDVRAKFRRGITIADLMERWCGGCYIEALLQETRLNAEFAW